MQFRLSFIAIVIASTGCGGGGGVLLDGGPDTPEITGVTPDHGPLGGGLRVTVTGSGFLANGAPPNRVLIGGREAAAAGVIDDHTLEVVVPAGAAAGDAEVTLFNSNGYAEATGVFRYREAPTVTSITPAEVVYSAASTQMTITGTGFVDDGAGSVSVFLDDFRAIDVDVVSDTTITFTATAGPPLSLPDVRVVNDNGEGALVDGFRYVPATADGLLLFAVGDTFAFYFDPATATTIAIPAQDTNPATQDESVVRSIVQDANGVYWAQTRSGRFGQMDMTSQTLIDPIEAATPTMAAMGRLGDTIYAVERNTRLGTLDTATGQMVTLGPPIGCCGSFAVAANSAGTLYFVNAGEIGTVDTATGDRATPVALNPVVKVEDMRFFNGTLYAVTNEGTLITINPSTGATAVVTTLPSPRLHSIEVFQ